MRLGRNLCDTYLSALTKFRSGALPVTGVMDKIVHLQKSVDLNTTVQIRARFCPREASVTQDMKNFNFYANLCSRLP